MKHSVEVIEERLYHGVVADEVVASINDCIDSKGSCTIALAGGGTPSGTYRLLSRPPRSTDIDWSKVHLFWGDERFVPKDSTHSNYKMINETLISKVEIPEANIHAMNTDLSSVKESAKDYGKNIKSFFGKELPEFDLVLLGIGSDGHTASLFPGFKKSNEIVVPGFNKNDSTDRISFNLNLIFNAKRIIFLATGRGKSEILNKVLNLDSPDNNYPSSYFLDSSEKVTWFIDTAASKGIENL